MEMEEEYPNFLFDDYKPDLRKFDSVECVICGSKQTPIMRSGVNDDECGPVSIPYDNPKSNKMGFTVAHGDVCFACLKEMDPEKLWIVSKCGVCGHFTKSEEGYMCDRCERIAGGLCCVALCWCQCGDCICRECYDYKCKRCGSNLDRNRSYVGDREDENRPLCMRIFCVSVDRRRAG